MHAHNESDFCSVPEVLLMLRAPGAGWLATLLSALDEATRDPDFNAYHRAVLARCLDDESVPAAIADSARQRAIQFEQVLAADTAGTDYRDCRAAG